MSQQLFFHGIETYMLSCSESYFEYHTGSYVGLRQASNIASSRYFWLRLGENWICQNWNLSESVFCHFLKKLEFVRMNLSESEFVRIGICQNRNLPSSLAHQEFSIAPIDIINKDSIQTHRKRGRNNMRYIFYFYQTQQYLQNPNMKCDIMSILSRKPQFLDGLFILAF